MSTRRGAPRSEGFTMVEVVIAASIMFFALNALFGLAAATSQMAGTSRGRTLLTNVITGRFDLYRTYSFSDLELQSKGGLIPDNETATTAGWTIHLVSTVVAPTSYPDTKEVTIVGTASHPGMPAVAYLASVVLRGLRASSSSGETTNTVAFADPTLADRSVVSGIVVIRASATSSMNKIAAFEFKVNTGSQDVYLIDSAGNSSIYSSMQLPEPMKSPYTQALAFLWDSPRLDGSGHPLFPDGFRTVSIWMRDDHGHAQGPTQRAFLLDNYGPQTPPTNMLITPSRSMSGPAPALTVSGSWGPALDGTDAAPRNEASLLRDLRSNVDGGLAGMSQTATYTASPTLSSGDIGFSRWVLRGQGFSPLGHPGVVGVSAIAYTPPIITGTGTQSAVAGYNVAYHASLVLPAPQYPIGSVTSIQVQRTVGGATSYITLSGAAAQLAWGSGSYTVLDTLTQNGISKNSAAADVTYRVLIQLIPAGYGTDQTPVLTSSAIVLHSTTSAKNVGASAPLTASASW